VVVSGVVTDGVVTLDMAFTATAGARIPPFTQHFEGRLLGFNTLSGTLTENGSSTPYSYRRIK
jgi:hypothetical protein